MASYAQITQNNKFAISLEYLKKVNDEVDFLHAVKHLSLLQIDTIILMRWSSILKVSYNIWKKQVKDEVDFLQADKHQSFVKVYFNTLGINVSCKVDIINRHDQVFSK